MTRGLRALDTQAEDLGLVGSTRIAAHNICDSSSRVYDALSDL